MSPATSVVVLSGKGGTAKTMWQVLMAGEASREGLSVLLVDVDPERNLSNRFRAPSHGGGLAAVLEGAGVSAGEANPDKGAERVAEEILPTKWDGVELLPAGANLQGISQLAIADTWLLHDIVTAAGIPDRYDLVLYDTGGRTGSLVATAMYASTVTYAPITATTDAIGKALEARARVGRIQRAHPLRWAGVVVTGFDSRVAVDMAIREETYGTFGDEVRAEVPRRASIAEVFQLGERLGDRRSPETTALAQVIRGFLLRDLMHRSDPTIPATGVLR